MIAVFRHELQGLFHSLTAYVCGAFLLAFLGLGSMLYNIQQAVSNFELVLGFGSIILAIVIPLLTMRVLSEERRQKTDQLLYSLPLTTTQVIAGKYLALLTAFALPMAIVLLYPVVFAQFGEVYLPTAYGSILAFFLVGAALIALGVFISSLTDNQGLAAGIGIAVILLNYYSVDLAEHASATALGSAVALVVLAMLLGVVVHHLTGNETLASSLTLGGSVLVMAVYFLDSDLFEGLLPRLMTQLSLFDRLYVFINGVFDLTGVVYFLSFIAFFLFLSVQSMEKRRYN